jgi:chromate transport protein ChrA
MSPLMWSPELWWDLFCHFLDVSLMAIGGAITLVPDLHLAPSLQTQPKALLMSVVVALVVWRTKVGLIWLVAAGGLLGGLGLV